MMRSGGRIGRVISRVPRKNGKSELAAAFALYGLVGDGVIGAEVYSAAADRDQAALVFNVAAQMVRNDPLLSSRLTIIDSQKRIVDYQTGSFYRAISAEAYQQARLQCVDGHLRRAARGAESRTVGCAGDLDGRPLRADDDCHHDRRLRPPFDLLGAARLRAARFSTVTLPTRHSFR